MRHLLVSKVRGHFNTFSGAVVVGEDGARAVTAEIAIDSVDTRNEQRDAHLKVIFDVEHYPTASFVSTAVRENGDSDPLDGDFTLKGITKPVTLDLEFNGTNPGMGHCVSLHLRRRAEPQGLRHRITCRWSSGGRRRGRQGRHHP